MIEQSKEKSIEEFFGPVISRYTRANAIEDGVLVDVSDMAKEAGIKFPTAVTAEVWKTCVMVHEGVQGQDETGRLWDILWMLRHAIKSGNGGSQLTYSLYVRNSNAKPVLYHLKSICGPGDEWEPVITIMMPWED